MYKQALEQNKPVIPQTVIRGGIDEPSIRLRNNVHHSSLIMSNL